MGGVCCCFSEPVDFDGEVNLYHFDLHRAVGKGAFGKVRDQIPLTHLSCLACMFSTGQSRRVQTNEKTLRSQVHRQSQMHQAEGCRQCHPGAQASGGGTPQS